MKKALKNIWMTVSYPLLHVSAQLVVSIIGIFFISIIVGFNIGVNGGEMDPISISQQVTEKVNVNLIAIISALISFLVIFLVNRKKGKAKEVYHLKKLKVSNIFYIVVLAVAFYMFIGYTLTITNAVALFPEYEETMGIILGNSNFLLELLSVVVFAPILEEVIYRNMVLGKLRNIVNLPLAIFIQAFLFGLVHGNILQGIYAFVIGCLFGLLFVWTDSLWACILAHVIFNLIGFIGSRQPETEGEISTVVGIVVIAVSLIISLVMMYLINKRKEQQIDTIAKSDLE